MARTRAHALTLILEDAVADAMTIDGQPFNGRTVATQLGNQLAMIAALARVVETLLPESEREAEKARTGGE